MGDPTSPGCCQRMTGSVSASVRTTKKEIRGVGKDIRHIWNKMELGRRIRSSFTVDKAKDHLPITKWLPKYRLKDFQGDLIAGVTIGLTVIPQSLAQASVANLRPEYGLYTAFMGVFVYAFLGTSRDCSLGPTSVASLMTSQYGVSFVPMDGTVATALCFISGCIALAVGLLKIGIVAEFISHPVLSAFTTSAGITIGFSQFKNWFGVKGISNNVFQGFIQICQRWSVIKWADFGLGLAGMIILGLLKQLKDIRYDKSVQVSTLVKIRRKLVWLAGVSRNVILVLITAGMCKGLYDSGRKPFSLTGYIPPGLPPVRPPYFSMNVTTNSTYTYYGPSDFFAKMGAGVFVVPFIGIVENIAIGKEFGRRNGYLLDQNQEVLAFGVSNIVGSFFSSYPMTASFSRSALLAASGVRTPLAGIYTGALVLLALGVLTPACYFIPSPILAAIVVTACWDLLNFRIVGSIWKKNKADLFSWFVTFVVGLAIQIEYGLFAGIGVTFIFLLYPWSRQSIQITAHKAKRAITKKPNSESEAEPNEEESIALLKFSGSILFPGIENIRDKIMFQAAEGKAPGETPSPVILDFSHVSHLDFSSIECFGEMIQEFHKHHSSLVFTHLQPNVLEALIDAKLRHFVHYHDNDEALRVIRGALHPHIPTSSIKDAGDSDSDDASAPSTSAGSDAGTCKVGDESKPSSGDKLAINVPNGHDNKGFEMAAAMQTPLPYNDVEAAAPPYNTLYPDGAQVRSRNHTEYDRDMNSYL